MVSGLRHVYERRPYPGTNAALARRPKWELPPMEWIQALIGKSAQAAPKRILVAGCGTGNEAFALGRRFPQAKITAVDFSVASIKIARDWQRRSRGLGDIRFSVRDMKADLRRALGGDFDFISCHGVLTYIVPPGRVLRNLARCLSPDGVLYLGVNGAAHYSTRWRQGLEGLGIDTKEFEDTRQVRELLKLLDALTEDMDVPVAKLDAPYLASDLFGPALQNLPLNRWVEFGREAGLLFRGSYSSRNARAKLASGNFYQLLWPRSRAEVCEFVDALSPASFHRLIFSRNREMTPPWNSREKLLRWRSRSTGLFRLGLPPASGKWQSKRSFALKCPATNTLLEFSAPEWQIEILRRCRKEISLGEIVRSIPVAISGEELIRFLFLLYQLSVIHFEPPASTA